MEDDRDKFVDAICNNKIDTLREMIDNGFDVNEVDNISASPGLMWAMYYNQPAILTMLLSHPNIDLAKSSRSLKYTGLHKGCQNNSVECVELFLRHPKCTSDIVTSRNSYGNTAVMFATERGNYDCVRLVREYLDSLDLSAVMEKIERVNTEPASLQRLTRTQLAAIIDNLETREASFKNAAELKRTNLGQKTAALIEKTAALREEVATLEQKLSDSLDEQEQHDQKTAADLIKIQRKKEAFQEEMRQKENS